MTKEEFEKAAAELKAAKRRKETEARAAAGDRYAAWSLVSCNDDPLEYWRRYCDAVLHNPCVHMCVIGHVDVLAIGDADLCAQEIVNEADGIYYYKETKEKSNIETA